MLSVPIIPDYLYSMEHPSTSHTTIQEQSNTHIFNNTKDGTVLHILKHLNQSLFGKGGSVNRSISSSWCYIVLIATKETLPDEHIPEDIIEENGKVGALFASKALVQLLVNPCVGSITNSYGYSFPFIFGTVALFLSSMSKNSSLVVCIIYVLYQYSAVAGPILSSSWPVCYTGWHPPSYPWQGWELLPCSSHRMTSDHSMTSNRYILQLLLTLLL